MAKKTANAKVNTKAKKAQEEELEEDEELLEDDEELEDEELEDDEDDDEDSDEDEEDEDEDSEDDDEDDEDELEDDDDEDSEDEEDEDSDEEDEEDEDEDSEDDDEDDEEDEDDDEDFDEDEEDEDEDSEDDDEDDEEDEEPVKTKKPSKTVSKSSKKAAPAKKEKAAKKAKKTITYADYFKDVENKVNTYDEKNDAENNSIPPSKRISEDLFGNLVATYEDEDGNNLLKKFISKIAKKLGIDSNDIDVDGLELSGEDGKLVIAQVIGVIKDVVFAGAHVRLWATDESNVTLKATRTQERITDNSALNTKKGRTHSKIGSYVKVSCLSEAPKAVKQIGSMNGKKFVPAKEEKKTAKAAPAVKENGKTAKALAGKKPAAKAAPAKKTGKKK